MAEDFRCGFKCGKESCAIKMAVPLDDIIRAVREDPSFCVSSVCDEGSCPFYQNYSMLEKIVKRLGCE